MWGQSNLPTPDPAGSKDVLQPHRDPQRTPQTEKQTLSFLSTLHFISHTVIPAVLHRVCFFFFLRFFLVLDHDLKEHTHTPSVSFLPPALTWISINLSLKRWALGSAGSLCSGVQEDGEEEVKTSMNISGNPSSPRLPCPLSRGPGRSSRMRYIPGLD